MTDDLDLHALDRPYRADPDFRAELRARIVDGLGQSAPAITTAPAVDEEELIMLVEEDTRTTTLRSRRRRPPFRWVAAAAAVVVLATAVVVSRGDGEGDGEDVALGGATPVYDDGFDEPGGWYEEPVPGISVETGGGQQVWRVSAPRLYTVLRPFGMREKLVDMEVTAEVVSVSPGATLGLLCRKGLLAPEDPFYAFRLGPDGASIAANLDDGSQAFASDPAVEVPSGPFTMSVRCVDEDGVARLALSIDGRQVLTATHDRPLTAGVGAIDVAGSADADDSEIVLDRFVVTPVS